MGSSRIVKIGSRESSLAVRQAEIVMDAIKKSNPDLDLKLVTFKTQGDKILDRTLDKIGGKGLFTKELEQALLEREIDIAVHSYKDMPCEKTEETEALPVVALSERESPFDALVLPLKPGDGTLPVGSSSLRRSIQYKMLCPNIETAPIRGNVPTRLDKLDRGEYSAIILAQAGLVRLNLQHRISKIFSVDEMIPSASQGILAIQGQKDGDYSYLADFHSKKSEYASKAERNFLRTIGGGCNSPVAAYAEIHGNEMRLTGMYVDESNRIEKGRIDGTLGEAENMGEALALKLKNKAAN